MFLAHVRIASMRRLWRVFGTSLLMRRADIYIKKTFCDFPWVVTSTGQEGLWFVCVFYDGRMIRQ